MNVDLTQMLRKIEAGRWNLEDIDWDKPGGERIRPEQFADLRDFMSDLVWIEHIGARGFAALARQSKDPVLAAIYRHFEREEQQHARAELALMQRWGMVEEGEVPVANKNIRLAMQWLDRHADEVNLTTLTCVIAMLEVALDGALVKFLLDEVDDPLCHEVFAHINRDEARHLTVDFHMMEQVGMKQQLRQSLLFIAGMVNPHIVIGVLIYIPLLSRMRANIVKMGLDEGQLIKAIRRFDEIGSRGAYTKRTLAFRVTRSHSRMVVRKGHPYHYVGDTLVALTRAIPKRLLGPLPTWTQSLATPVPGRIGAQPGKVGA